MLFGWTYCAPRSAFLLPQNMANVFCKDEEGWEPSSSARDLDFTTCFEDALVHEAAFVGHRLLPMVCVGLAITISCSLRTCGHQSHGVSAAFDVLVLCRHHQCHQTPNLDSHGQRYHANIFKHDITLALCRVATAGSALNGPY
ncbi:hypothetical protein BC936DRAFT_147321 [Jimgerdemannia flammicorona]|uniref:ABC transporter TMD0 domain-containing protein n=1 Tax=Jimgerdemannia flammicorona TaxID=994334 RepID=A0A433DL17_9FUNG|nr:hypothetical protein BC936DRAFT_147321 [Jimgerdemannia flammicorona]